MAETLKLTGAHSTTQDVQRRVQAVGVKNLDIEKAKELGLFQRISYVLCACHASIVAAYRMYGDVDYLLSLIGGRKNEIAREMNLFDKAFERFARFWSGYYASRENAQDEMNEETEALYHNIMAWAQLPENWELGDKQRTEDPITVTIKVQTDNRTLNFNKSIAESEMLDEVKESWCVTKYDKTTGMQESVYTDMDKASALMCAKRLSDDDKESLYTASMVQEITERRVEVTPYKVFKANDTIGKISNILTKG